MFSNVVIQGRNSRCLIMWSENTSPKPGTFRTRGLSFCDEGLPDIEPGAVLDDSVGNVDEGVRSLLLLVPPETVSVRMTTTTGATYTVFSAAGIAYLEWPEARGKGVHVVGLDASDEEKWSQDLPFDGR